MTLPGGEVMDCSRGASGVTLRRVGKRTPHSGGIWFHVIILIYWKRVLPLTLDVDGIQGKILSESSRGLADDRKSEDVLDSDVSCLRSC